MSKASDTRLIRYTHLLATAVIVGGWIWGWAQMSRDIEHNAATIEAVRLDVADDRQEGQARGLLLARIAGAMDVSAP